MFHCILFNKMLYYGMEILVSKVFDFYAFIFLISLFYFIFFLYFSIMEITNICMECILELALTQHTTIQQHA